MLSIMLVYSLPKIVSTLVRASSTFLAAGLAGLVGVDLPDEGENASPILAKSAKKIAKAAVLICTIAILYDLLMDWSVS